jgi:hypothetical protein
VLAYVHESNAVCIPISKNPLYFFYCLYSLVNKIVDKGKTVSAWKQGGGGEREGSGEKTGAGGKGG